MKRLCLGLTLSTFGRFRIGFCSNAGSSDASAAHANAAYAASDANKRVEHSEHHSYPRELRSR